MIRGLALALLLAAPALGETSGGLEGRTVTFGALLYEDDRDKPIFEGARHVAEVGPGLEYGLEQEGPQNGWDIVPAYVDISDDRVVIRYPPDSTAYFPEIGFNGYVLDFLVDCVLFRSARVDTELSTGTLSDADLFVEGARLYIDVGGQKYEPATTFAIQLEVMDCPIG
ncbi:hypothetical protein [Roseisalinus antarcticus]|uniref:Uncharacterized protein n=1 Tax=Roseisalinus antarcticus TaxID=254357 RepID=A0A1Y5RQB1_9RHOB|nr:hypothetical protein [Roseisalinus antarcticus]SLN21912.1 hypothetical protein ROA7023_00601 [Roseisalinus antarcticus]